MQQSTRGAATRVGRFRAIAVLFSMLATVIFAGPAAATTPPPDYGSGVQCRYHSGGPGPAHIWKLRKIVVAPPVMYADHGQQMVGWRFVVERSLHSQDGPWKVTYKSPIQKRTATTTNAAAFDTKSVDVVLPNVENPPDVEYRVTLKMFRYQSDGSVQSKVTYLMPTYAWLLNGNDYGDGDGARSCIGTFYEGP